MEFLRLGWQILRTLPCRLIGLELEGLMTDGSLAFRSYDLTVPPGHIDL